MQPALSAAQYAKLLGNIESYEEGTTPYTPLATAARATIVKNSTHSVYRAIEPCTSACGADALVQTCWGLLQATQDESLACLLPHAADKALPPSLPSSRVQAASPLSRRLYRHKPKVLVHCSVICQVGPPCTMGKKFSAANPGF